MNLALSMLGDWSWVDWGFIVALWCVIVYGILGFMKVATDHDDE